MATGTNRRRYLHIAGVLVSVSSAGCIESLGGSSDDEPETDSPEDDDPDDGDESNPDGPTDSPINPLIDSAVSNEEVTLSVVESGTASHFVLRGGIGGVEKYTEGDKILDGGTGSTWSSTLSGSGEVFVIGVADDGEGKSVRGVSRIDLRQIDLNPLPGLLGPFVSIKLVDSMSVL